jgi:DNA polymerase-3 subunit alpha
MPDVSFIHLRLHSEFSVTDGIVRLDDAVARAAADGMPALALTDLANLFGLVKFYNAARYQGVKPLLGSDVHLASDYDNGHAQRLLLLCRSHRGYLQLCELLSRAYLAPRVHGRAEITRRMLQDVGVDGLIALSGGGSGDVGEALLQGQYRLAADCARQWAALFPDAYYLEVQRYGQPQQDALVTATVELAAELDLPLVATHPVQFLERDDFRAHEARVCIAEGYMLGDSRRPRLYTEEQYFKSSAEMCALFADLPQALANSVEIARRCNLQITLGKSYLPDFPTPPGVTLADYLRQQRELMVMHAKQFVGNHFRRMTRAQQVFHPRPVRAVDRQPGRTTHRGRQCARPCLRSRRTISAGNTEATTPTGLCRRIGPSVTFLFAIDRTRRPL